MSQIKFELTLPSGANSDIVVVNGGADSDHNGKIDQNGEMDSFARSGNTWSRTQNVEGKVSGTLFYVLFVVGKDTPWELTVTNDAGVVLHRSKNTTIKRWSDVVGELS